ELETINGQEAHIVKILPRKNYIIRKSINLSRQSQIIASNMDQAVLIATIVAPRTSLGFIDRFLVTAEAYSIPAKIIFNKCVLLDASLLSAQREIIAIYTGAGYPCFEASMLQKESLEKIRILFENKVTLLAGHSGVGKSTLINALQ